MEYLILPRLVIQRANALSTPWSVTMTPIFACTMFAHALGLDTNTKPVATAIIHHDAQLLSDEIEYGIHPQQYRGATYMDDADYSSKNKYALSLQPTVSMHMELSLILLFPDAAPSIKKAVSSLHKRRIAGGLILDHGELMSVDSFDQAMRFLSGGFFITDRSDELKNDRLGRIETLLALVNDPVDNEKKRRWLSPAVTGYAATTGFKQRQGVRENRLHAFVEPLVGLTEYVSVAEQKKLSLDEKLTGAYFWREKWLPNDVVVVQADSVVQFQKEYENE